MFKPKPASILLLVGGIAVVIGVLAAWPATVLLVVAAALSFRAPDREETYELGNVAALSRILDL